VDPISSQMIEEQPNTLKEQSTIVVVIHLLRQAHRLANHVIFLWMGKLVESGAARNIFSNPRDNRARAFLAGDIG